jgi:hypothetical protein
MTTVVETKTKPSAVDAQDALNNIRQSLGILYCVLEASDIVEKEDVAGALGLATTHLHRNLQTVRAHFGMDEKEAAS